MLGTPGVGKSRLCKAIADKCKYNNVEVSAIAKRENFIQSHDDEYDCPVIDEDAVKKPKIYNLLNIKLILTSSFKLAP